MRAFVLIAVGLLLSACSQRSATPGTSGGAAPQEAPPAPAAAPAPAPAPAPAAASPQELPSCGDFAALEEKIGDGLLTKEQLGCLEQRLAVAVTDADRYAAVHLLTIDLDANGLAAEAQAIRAREMPKVDCGNVEARLRPVCELQKGAARVPAATAPSSSR